MSKPIIFAPNSTGSAEPRDIRDRFADMPNVKDFGAKGDGVTDDTAAFTAAQSSGAPAIMVSNGTYKITQDVSGTFFSFGNVSIIGGGNVEIIDVLSFDSIANQLSNNIQSKVALNGSNLSGAAVKAVVQTWHSGTQWYRVWSDGWIEQGGYLAGSFNGGTVTLPKPFSNASYILVSGLLTWKNDNTYWGRDFGSGFDRTATSFKAYTPDKNNSTQGKTWYACGF